MKYVSTLVLACMVGVALGQESSLLGSWVNSEMGFQMVLAINQGGKGEFDGEPIQYKIQGSKLIVLQDGVSITYNYVVNGNRLALSGGDLDEPLSFQKVGTSGNDAEVAKQSSTASTPAATALDKKLLGNWSGNGESISFTADGTCNYLGQSYPFQTGNNQITLSTSQGPVSFAYAIQGDQLSLSVNGRSVIYARGNAAAVNTKSNNSNGKGHVAQELVGKWCFANVTSTNSGGTTTDECIILNADGTYEYNYERTADANTSSFYVGTNANSSDRGTWSYDGSRIYYNSPTNGQGSYELRKLNHPKNNDPMIVLDGKSYVTYYQKPSW